MISIINNFIRDFKNQKVHEKTFTILLYLVYILYITSYFFGFNNNNYIDYARLALKYYVIIFLLIKFNPFSSFECNSFDKVIIFKCALFLLFTTNLLNIN